MPNYNRHCVDDPALVSVVIPTRNSGNTIENCLKSIKGQTYREIEIILVDSFSSDDTARIAEKTNARVIALEGERTKAKNRGLRTCGGRYVCFIDTNMILKKRDIKQNMESGKADVAGVTIPERSIGNRFWV